MSDAVDGLELKRGQPACLFGLCPCPGISVHQNRAQPAEGVGARVNARPRFASAADL